MTSAACRNSSTAIFRSGRRAAPERRALALAVAAVLLACDDLAAATCPDLGPNLAQGRPYALEPHPNYRAHTEGDATDLTDGRLVGPGTKRGSLVEWEYSPSARVAVQLAADPATCARDAAACPRIGRIRAQVRTRTDLGTRCPDAALFEVSDDGETYHRVGTWTSDQHPACAHRDRKTRGVWIESPCLATRGAYARVTFEPDTRHFSLAEVEVRAGKHAHAQRNAQPDPFDAAFRRLGERWRVMAVSPWQRLGGRILPEDGLPASDARSLSLALARGERGATAIAVSNPGSGPRTLTVRLGPLARADGLALGPDVVRVRHAREVQGQSFRGIADALTLAPATLTAPAQQLTHLLLDAVVPREAAPGRYDGSLELHLACDTCGPARRLPVSVTVRDFALPPHADLPARFFDWSKSIPEGAHRRPGALADARAAIRRAYGANAHRSVPLPRPNMRSGAVVAPARAQFADVIAEIERHANAWPHLLYFRVHKPPMLDFAGLHCFATEGPARQQWEAAFEVWVRAVVEVMTSPPLSLPYERFALYPVDEPRTSNRIDATDRGCGRFTRMDVFEVAAGVIKRIDPRLQVFVNVAQKRRCDPKHGCPLDRLVEASLVDIWMPARRYVESDDPGPFFRERRDAYSAGRARDRVWVKEHGRITFVDSDPHATARFPIWKMAAERLMGFGFFNLYRPARLAEGKGRVSAWRPLDGQGQSWIMVYPLRPHDAHAPGDVAGDESIAPARRLWAVRQGIEDYRHVVLVDRLLAQPGLEPALQRASQQERDAALASVVAAPEDRGAPDRARARLVALIETLRAASPAASAERPAAR